MKIAIVGAGNVGRAPEMQSRCQGLRHCLRHTRPGKHRNSWRQDRGPSAFGSGRRRPCHAPGAELLQSQARRAKFYKAFNSTGVSVMAKPGFAEGNAVMFVAGPGGPDKKTVLRIVADVGFEAIDAGELKAARLLEPLAMLWVQLALKHHDRDFAFVVARRDAANRRAKPRVRVVHSHPQEVE